MLPAKSMIYRPLIWHLAELLIWLRDVKMYLIDDSLLEIAKITMNLNIARSYQKIEPSLQENINCWVF